MSYSRLILASGSPRRKELLAQLGFAFEVRSLSADESFPSTLRGQEISEHICATKAKAIVPSLTGDDLALTADTVVCLDNMVLNKASDANEASQMLRLLSGKVHEVITSFALVSLTETQIVSDVTKVHFLPLSEDDIAYYISTCKPFDKAGAYGIQEWIGLSAVERIEGSFYTVMGLPTHKVYPLLKKYLRNQE